MSELTSASADLTAALRAALPTAVHPHVPTLVGLLLAAAGGTMPAATVQQQLASDPALQPLLAALVGQRSPTTSNGITVSAEGSQGDVTISVGGDVAGGNILKGN